MIENSNSQIPVHIGFIMDGNRRWGKKRGLKNPIAGTAAGVDTLFNITEASIKRGIKFITVYAFSTENWKREEGEVNYLMNLLIKVIPELEKRALKADVQLKLAGRLESFPEEARKVIETAIEGTKNCKRAILNLAASYGGKAEIIDAVQRIIKDGIVPEEITEEKFAEYVYEVGQPDLDLIVRTGGMRRLSGFMLWQSTYAEMYFTDTLWPDFNEVELDKALDYFKEVKRNFGK